MPRGSLTRLRILVTMTLAVAAHAAPLHGSEQAALVAAIEVDVDAALGHTLTFHRQLWAKHYKGAGPWTIRPADGLRHANYIYTLGQLRALGLGDPDDVRLLDGWRESLIAIHWSIRTDGLRGWPAGITAALEVGLADAGFALGGLPPDPRWEYLLQKQADRELARWLKKPHTPYTFKPDGTVRYRTKQGTDGKSEELANALYLLVLAGRDVGFAMRAVHAAPQDGLKEGYNLTSGYEIVNHGFVGHSFYQCEPTMRAGMLGMFGIRMRLPHAREVYLRGAQDYLADGTVSMPPDPVQPPETTSWMRWAVADLVAARDGFVEPVVALNHAHAKVLAIRRQQAAFGNGETFPGKALHPESTVLVHAATMLALLASL